ncbi:conserved hypothetical protein [Paenibacillus curdlanolyticus YK9]|uniref:Uncharacterized protein n=1 Tax=Paenibacillus curdlanolyticus YK9 TaxID=717606 RepID=E0IEF0_9BACL|nr:hypothetical protein [Paenibacillus curdlanolyticus]EFM09038.1 conserved hypothetical protein [Paenibacillus curdlanolyticus YK9]
MKYSWQKLALAVVLLGGGALVGSQWVSTAQGDGETVTPGSVDDPVVTKSYVDQAVSKQSGVSTEDVQQMLNDLKGELTKSMNQVVVVAVPAGKTLFAADGAEFVVRAGKAVAYSGDANGISDLTDGKDITNGKAVPNNHLILFPRGGRGVLPDPAQKNGLTVMVRGGYELK